MRKTLYALLCCSLLAVPAAAGTLDVSYSTSAAGPYNNAADSFSLGGQSGTLTLNDSGITTQTINSGYYTTGDSGPFTGAEPLTLSYSLTLDGVTHTLTQTATSWAITPSVDTLDVAASSPVLFVTPQGNWDVTLDAFSFSTAQLGTDTLAFQADFASTPEPDSLFLVGTSLVGIGLLFRRKLGLARYSS